MLARLEGEAGHVHLLEFLLAAHVLAEILNFVELLLLEDLEEGEAGWGFE